MMGEYSLHVLRSHVASADAWKTLKIIYSVALTCHIIIIEVGVYYYIGSKANWLSLNRSHYAIKIPQAVKVIGADGTLQNGSIQKMHTSGLVWLLCGKPIDDRRYPVSTAIFHCECFTKSNLQRWD